MPDSCRSSGSHRRLDRVGAHSLVLFLAVATAASAETRVYRSAPALGTGGDTILVNPTGEGGQDVRLGDTGGVYRLADDGAGTVTLESLVHSVDNQLEVDITLLFGPAAFIFIDTATSIRPAPGQTGVGATTAGTGSVAWGIVASWTATGARFCVASPTITCEEAGLLHGTTVPAFVASSTFDLGTWSFDAEGDFEAPPYVAQSFSGGVSNDLRVLRGSFVGAGVPVATFGVWLGLLLALAVAGVRKLGS